MRFTFEYEGEERKKPINSGLGIFVVSSVIYTVLIVIAGSVIHIPYLIYIYLYGLLMNMQTLVGYLARTYSKNALYTTSGLVSSFVTVMCNIVFIVYFKMDYSALFISACIGYLVNIIILGNGIKLHKLISVKAFDLVLFKKLFWFSIPLCMNSVAYWFLTSYNRVAIVNVLGTEANGMYSIAGRFASFITLFTGCFNMAWQEMSYSREAETSVGQESFYTKAINSYIKFLGMGFLILIPGIFIIFPIMINDSYAQAKVLIPYYLLGTIASAVSAFLGNVFTAIKKNGILFYTTVLGSIINVITVHLLLPVVGVQGASMALFLGFLINIVVRIIYLKKEVKVSIDWKFMGMWAILVAGVIWIYNLKGIFWNITAALFCLIVTVLVFRENIVEIWKGIKGRLSN